MAREARLTDEMLDLSADCIGTGKASPYDDLRVAEGNELEHALLSITAASHAIDGFYGSLRPFVNRPAQFKNAPRHRQILETLKHGFDVGKHSATWKDDLEWLFDFRDSIVHHGDRWGPIRVTRDTERVVVIASAERSRLTAESAERAVAIARDVIDTCTASPKPSTSQWVAGWTDNPDAIDEQIHSQMIVQQLFPIDGGPYTL